MKNIFTKDSWFNKFLRKYFNRNIIFSKSTFYYQEGKSFFTCQMCRNGHWELSSFKSDKYLYRLSDNLDLQIQPEFNEDDLRIYGWAIEVKYVDADASNWYQHWNHNIYRNKKDAIDAINQFTKSSSYRNRIGRSSYEYRVIPLYNISQNYYRNITINKIIREK